MNLIPSVWDTIRQKISILDLRPREHPPDFVAGGWRLTPDAYVIGWRCLDVPHAPMFERHVPGQYVEQISLGEARRRLLVEPVAV